MALLFTKGSAMYQKTTNLFIFCLILFIVLVSCPYRFIIIKGDSMLPTYKNNQIVLARKVDNYKKNDVIVFKSENDNLIKRIIYVGGETIYFYLDKERIFIDNSYDSVNDFKKMKSKIYLYSFIIPENSYFVMGDNLKHSDDSRRFGWIDEEEILYKVID